MFRNYVVTASRRLRKHKLHAFINVFGLALGIAVCLLIYLYVQDELRYDAFNARADRIYRVNTSYRQPNGARQRVAVTSMPVGPGLVADFPGVEKAVRFRSFHDVVHRGNLSAAEQLTFTDPSFFDVFSFPVLGGDPGTALDDPNSVVLTPAMARKYFGTDDAVGQVLKVKLGGSFQELTVRAVVGQPPGPSSVSFDVLLPFAAIKALVPDYETRWRGSNTFTFVLLAPGSDAAAVEAQLPAFVARHVGADMTQSTQLVLQPLLRVHLDPSVSGGMVAVGRPTYSYILSGIALLVLLVAAFNFMNLSIAGATARAAEIGLRKVTGAHRGQLMRQFLSEALLMSLLAMLVGLALAELFLPTFNQLAQKHIAAGSSLQPSTLLALVGVAVMAGLAAGSYPAFVLSGFRPVEVLKGRFRPGRSGLLTRALIITQFALAIFLIAGTVLMRRQVDFLKTKDLGLDTEQVLVLPTHSDRGADMLGLLRQETAQMPGVAGVTGSNEAVGDPGTFSISYASVDENTYLFPYLFRIDHAYLETMGITLAAGRNLSPDFPADATHSILVNEALAKRLGWDDPVGKELTVGSLGEEPMRVVGVVQDFHFQSLYAEVDPAVLHVNPAYPLRHVEMRLRTDDLPATLARLRAAWQRIAPDYPFDYTFLDQSFDRQYRADERWGDVIGYAAVFAILIACLGLFGLAALVVNGRTKEIGIRKVMGASATSVVRLVSKDFAWLVLAANVVAWPLAYVAMQRWLEHFAYRVDVSWWIFVVAGAVALGVALVTVGYHALRSATADPVKALRYE